MFREKVKSTVIYDEKGSCSKVLQGIRYSSKNHKFDLNGKIIIKSPSMWQVAGFDKKSSSQQNWIFKLVLSKVLDVLILIL